MKKFPFRTERNNSRRVTEPEQLIGAGVDSRLGQFLETLPLAERLQRYRQLSQEALQKATDCAEEDMRAGYLSMAAGWHMLATEVERQRERQHSAQKLLAQGEGDTNEHAAISAAHEGDAAQ